MSSTSDSQFQSGKSPIHLSWKNRPEHVTYLGHKVPVSHQDQPGLQSDMKGKPPVSRHVPTEDGGYQLYKAAGKLNGKKALITGGDSGIGRAVAILFAMEGADSFINYLPEEEKDAQETKKKVEEYGRKCYLHPANITLKENCKKLVEEAVKTLGGLNIVVNNAAYQLVKKSISELSEWAGEIAWVLRMETDLGFYREQWVHTFNTNIHPYFYISKYALEYLKSGDTIINTSSINAYIGRPDLLDYTSTKGAIISFTRALSNQVVGKGLRVNAVCPGPGKRDWKVSS